MINERYRIAMAETLHYLKGVSQVDINKIPKKFMSFLKDNAYHNYECKFDYTKPLNELTLKNETRGLIAMICLNYWCETEEQKNSFMNHLNENEKRYQEYLQVVFNSDDIFKKKSETKTINENIDINKLPLQTKKESFLKRLFKRLIKYFK